MTSGEEAGLGLREVSLFSGRFYLKTAEVLKLECASESPGAS